MRVDVWSDIVCPWCYIGKARLQHALADFPDRRAVEVVFRSYQLDPTAPVDQPMPVLEMFAKKYGASPEQAMAAEARMAALARNEGLPYSSERDHGNTATVHRLLHYASQNSASQNSASQNSASQNSAGEQLLDSVFRTHFGGRASIFQPDVLLDLAEAAGLVREEAQEVIKGDRYLQEVRSDMEAARQLGVRGVPFFLIDGQLAVSGAQPAETLLEALETAWADQR